MKRTFLAAATTFAVLCAANAAGQNYPTKPVVARHALCRRRPGDTLARIFGERHDQVARPAGDHRQHGGRGRHDRLDESGAREAGRHTAADRARQPPNPALYRKLPYDPVKNFDPSVSSPTCP